MTQERKQEKSFSPNHLTENSWMKTFVLLASNPNENRDLGKELIKISLCCALIVLAMMMASAPEDGTTEIRRYRCEFVGNPA